MCHKQKNIFCRECCLSQKKKDFVLGEASFFGLHDVCHRAKNHKISSSFVQENTRGTENHSCLWFLVGNKNTSFWREMKMPEFATIYHSVQKC